MKKIALITSVSVVILTLLIVLSTYIISPAGNKPNTSPEPVPIPDTATKIADTTPIPEKSFVTSAVITGYMIKGNSNSLNVYEIYDNGHYKIIDTLDVSPSTLPKTDSEKLKKGIVTESYEQMCHIIEDYSS